MPKVIITRGLSGSGKTTWSRQFVKENLTYKRINRDDLRFMLYDGDYIESEEQIVTDARDSLLHMLLELGYNVVLDEPYLAPHRIREINDALVLIALDIESDIEVEIKDFIDASVESCIERDKPRGKNRHVGEAFIRMYHEKYVKPLLKDRGRTKWII